MRIGLTYDLKADYLAKNFSKEDVAEFDCIETIEAIEGVLVSLGHTVDRIGSLEPLMQQLLTGERWDMVFNIAEGLYGITREALIPALLEAYKIPCTFSPALLMVVLLDKAHTKDILASHGVAVGQYTVVRENSDVERVRIPYPLFAKPIAEGTSKGVTKNSLIRDVAALKTVCTSLLHQFRQPVLVEEYLPGREFTVGILGQGDSSRAIGVMEVLLHGDAEIEGYTYTNKQQYEDRVCYKLADEPAVAALALDAWRILGGVAAGRVDIKMNAKGDPCFIEANPLPGLNPVYSDLAILCELVGLPYHTLIEEIVEHSLNRT